MITGKRFKWQQKDVFESTVLYYSQSYDISKIISRCLINRGVQFDDVKKFLEPRIKDIMPDPFHLLDMEKAINRIIYAIKNQQRIVVYGDYDVDGATSSALVKKYFEQIKFKNIEIIIPDRTKDGYGPNMGIFQNLVNKKIDLVITLDCGIVAFEVMEYAYNAGLDVIIVDHHISTEVLPMSFAIINPNRIDQISQCKDCAAVGIAFFLIVALNKTLREGSFFEKIGILEPNIIDLLDLVALGTVCDVVKMSNINRALIQTGLKVLRQRKNTGLAILCDTVGIHDLITEYHLGYIIGPSINAGGRVGESNLGAALLSSCNKDVAYEMALRLHLYNQERKNLENQALNSAIQEAEIQFSEGNKCIFITGKWHIGIIGIVASRLNERFGVPIIVATMVYDIYKASARSVRNINIGAYILEARKLNLLLEGGGHAMAAGFSCTENQVDKLHKFLNEKMYNHIIEKYITYDSFLNINEINISLCDDLSTMSPFGVGNSLPKFVMENFEISNVKILKEQHISFIVNCRYKTKSIKAIFFRAFENSKEVYNCITSGNCKRILFKVNKNIWNGKINPQLIVEDVSDQIL